MVLTIFLCILIVVIALSCIGITGAVVYFLYHKSEYLKSQQYIILENIKEKNSEIPARLNDRIVATDKFLNLIDGMVNTEVLFLIQSRDLLNKTYDFKLAKEDITHISEKIVKEISPTIWNSVDIAINSDYLMDYTVSYVTITLLKTAKEYNTMVREI